MPQIEIFENVLSKLDIFLIMYFHVRVWLKAKIIMQDEMVFYLLRKVHCKSMYYPLCQLILFLIE